MGRFLGCVQYLRCTHCGTHTETLLPSRVRPRNGREQPRRRALRRNTVPFVCQVRDNHGTRRGFVRVSSDGERSLRANPLSKVKVKCTVKNAVREESSATAYGVFACEFDFDSQAMENVARRTRSNDGERGTAMMWIRDILFPLPPPAMPCPWYVLRRSSPHSGLACPWNRCALVCGGHAGAGSETG